jgi:uncharacterized RDD family membrane protein YckC
MTDQPDELTHVPPGGPGGPERQVPPSRQPLAAGPAAAWRPPRQYVFAPVYAYAGPVGIDASSTQFNGETSTPSSRARRAPLASRLGASLVDFLLLIGFRLGMMKLGIAPVVAEPVTLLIALAYPAYYDGVLQQSLGKRIFRIKVADIDRGGPIRFGRGLLRAVVRYLCVPLIVGLIVPPLLDPRHIRRGLQDYAAESIVLKGRWP